MLAQVDIKRKLATVFNEQQAMTLVEMIHSAYNDLVRQSLQGEVFPVCFCHRARSEVQLAVQQAGLRLFYSYG